MKKACSTSASARMEQPSAARSAVDVVDTAAGAGFDNLVAAVKAAGLVETLKGPGPYTVLAPTDEAFEKLPAGTLQSLLEPENKEKLASLLAYHVIPGKLTAKDIVNADAAKTLQGRNVAFKIASNRLMINEARVAQFDVAATNGIVHVIDTVLIPE